MNKRPLGFPSRPRLAGFSRFEDRLVGMTKFRDAGDLAWALYTRATMFANLNETDGLVALADLPHLLPEVATGRLGVRDADAIWRPLTPLDVVAQAVAGHVLDVAGPDTWVVHDFLDWNLSRAERGAERSAQAERGARGGAQAADQPRDDRHRFLPRPLGAEPSQPLGTRPNAALGGRRAPSPSPTDTPLPPSAPARDGVNDTTTMTAADLSAAAKAELQHPEPGPEHVSAILRRLGQQDGHD